VKALDAPFHPPSLRAYLRARRDAPTGLRAGRLLSAAATLVLALGMAFVRSTDGGAAYLEGVAARGLSLHLLLVALPFGYALAGRGAGGDAASYTLAALHGVDGRQFDAALAREALRGAAARGAWSVGLLGAEMAALSLPDGPLASKRAGLALALIATGAALGAAAALLGLGAARAAGRRGRLAFVAALAVPLVLDALVPGYPSWATLPGAYRAWVNALL
jgi:hypothetical protein